MGILAGFRHHHLILVTLFIITCFNKVRRWKIFVHRLNCAFFWVVHIFQNWRLLWVESLIVFGLGLIILMFTIGFTFLFALWNLWLYSDDLISWWRHTHVTGQSCQVFPNIVFELLLALLHRNFLTFLTQQIL